VATHGDLPMLEAQASKLRATIKRRTACPGASAEPDSVAAVVAHYGAVLAEIEEQIGHLKGAPSQEATQVPAAAAEPTPPAVPASGQAAAGKKKHVSFDAEEAGESGSPSVLKRPAAGSASTVFSSTSELPVSTLATVSSVFSSTSELDA
jgi:hypothetical protein